MKLELFKNRDFWAGIMMIGLGFAAIFIAHDYRFGSTQKMGAGFFPTILGGILIAFGICTIVMGLLNKVTINSHVSLRAIILLPLSLVLFGVLLENAGFVPALIALVFVSAASGREFKLKEVLLLTTLLTIAAVALFIWGLGLPYPLIKGL